MAIPVLIDSRFIERLLQQTYQDGMVPEIEGRLGRSNLLHACYRLWLTGPPSVVSTDEGSLVVRVPVEGHLSIPWGWGTKFMVEAEADLRPKIVGKSLFIEMGEFDVNRMSVGEGCSMPREVLRLIGPFVRGVMFPSKSNGSNGFTIEIPTIAIPLQVLGDEVTNIELSFENFMISRRGVVLYIGLLGECSLTLPPQPNNDGFDIVASIPQREAEQLIEATLRKSSPEIKGEKVMAIPDQTRLIDMMKASGESITSFGRRGLGRRALKSSSRVKLTFTARAGAPKLAFLEGNKIRIHDVPAHLLANAALEMEMPSGGLLDRIKSFFSWTSTQQQAAAEKEKVNVAQWKVDEDFTIDEVEVTVAADEAGRMQWKVTKLEVDLKLKWYLPEKTIEEMVEFIGGRVATARLPEMIPTELDLPGNMPIRLMLDRVEVTTVPGTLSVKVNVHLEPIRTAEESREAVKVMVEEQIDNVLKDRL